MRCENTRLALLTDTEEIIRRTKRAWVLRPKNVPSLFEFNIYTNHQVPVIKPVFLGLGSRDMLHKALTVRFVCDIQESKDDNFWVILG